MTQGEEVSMAMTTPMEMRKEIPPSGKKLPMIWRPNGLHTFSELTAILD
jgi:hypothetical protein